uniref:Glycogen debranching enzyme (Trinotate prediction) n=1 Tax=Henneguya salminicola TaxID=69463 RepID=A0A6G3MJE8_HENSL
MSTLDRSDWNYYGYYHNDNGSNDFKVGGGFNYHQGPEWLWLTGYYLRALIQFSKNNKHSEEFEKIIREMLSRLYTLEENNKWTGLPELTQFMGEYCQSSCKIQSWSISCVLEALYDFYSIYSMH